MIETGLISVLPPLIAIVLAFITKEVYSSLFIGVFSGMAIYVAYAHEPFVAVFSHIFDMMAEKIADNSYMIIFLALLWAVVTLVSRSGGSQAYGRWAGKRLKNRRSALLATSLLGMLVFIDDGFNCLTVGTVMRPITDRLKISREKLAYIIDATAAPVCIIAPVSSWAVAVASEVSEKNGFNIFLSTIPYNLYALLTIAMVFFICLTGKDFGPMKHAEERALGGENTTYSEDDTAGKGHVIDLVLPIVVLIVCAIAGMAYVGGFFSGTPFSEAIGENPAAGLTMGAFAALFTALLLYIPRRIMTPKTFINAIVHGIGSIVPPMLILVLSWSLGGVCRQMIGTGIFISGFVSTAELPLGFLPFLIFIIAALMSFSMGTSWGTFGMLIPIVTMICSVPGAAHLLVPALGATLAGSVYGDHCSPISDTTILSSTGADCPHINHVETQLPYATLVAGLCAVGYLVMGLVL
ncbi:MAG: Na+/H+ antiporter NhaC family protein [Spirochaetia bacterium]|nr:Na+/H+ antiporter NhaC family protein [Spirochaetia bacterium]